mgnify:CR=1 FL=1
MSKAVDVIDQRTKVNTPVGIAYPSLIDLRARLGRHPPWMPRKTIIEERLYGSDRCDEDSTQAPQSQLRPGRLSNLHLTKVPRGPGLLDLASA